jgi:hypothetical protein
MLQSGWKQEHYKQTQLESQPNSFMIASSIGQGVDHFINDVIKHLTKHFVLKLTTSTTYYLQGNEQA